MSANQALRRERELRGWSQAKMAEEVGTTLNTISSWERGLTTPSPYFRQRLCALLEKNALELGLVTYVQEQHEPVALSHLQHSNRQRLLTKVRTFWIDGVLEQSVPRSSFIPVALSERLEAVADSWHDVLHQPEKKTRSLPSGAHILQVYDEAGGELLILGQPGLGKTTLLLRLASEPLERAGRDETQLMPVVLNLSSWSRQQLAISDWLVEELQNRYQVPHKLGKAWVDGEQILPLLDGLDEVNGALRAACIDALNTYRKQHGLVPLVVCSRKADYLSIGKRLLLQEAIEIEPLTPRQIDTYLRTVGMEHSEIVGALASDSEFQELSTTPLMLSILAQMHKEAGEGVLTLDEISQPHRRKLFSAYVEQMLARRAKRYNYSSAETIIWLRWLAQQLQQRSQVEFYLEWMQADWLPFNKVRLLYHRLMTIISGLFLGIVCGLICALITFMLGAEPYPVIFWGFVLLGAGSGVVYEWAYKQNKKQEKLHAPQSNLRSSFKRGWMAATIFGLIYFIGFSVCLTITIVQQLEVIPSGFIIILLLSSIAGLTGGLASGLIIGLGLLKPLETTITPAEIISWSWSSLREQAWRNLSKGFVFGFVYGLTFAIVLLIEGWQILGPKVGLVVGLIEELVAGVGIGLIASLLAVIAGGIAQDRLPAQSRVRPNEGIWRSARNALLIGSIGGLLSGVLFGLLNQFIAWFVFELAFAIFGPIITIQGGPVESLSQKGLAVGLFSAAIIGLIAALRNGGMACIQHLVLRLLLWRTGSTPWNYERFLDYATERILLRKVGGGYIFLHRLLLEYFADEK